MRNKRILVMIATLITLLVFACTFIACNKTDNQTQKNDDNAPAVEYTVTFDSRGGSAVPAVKGKSVQTEPVPKKDGFDFVGWYASTEYEGDRIAFPYTISKDVTLYAKWQEKAKPVDYVQTTLDDFDYTEADGKITLTKYKGDKTDIVLPQNANILGGQLFQIQDGEEDIAKVRYLKVPKSVESIDGLTLFWAEALYSVEVDADNENYMSKDGVLFNKAQDILVAYPMGRSYDETKTSYVIPEGVKTIEKYAFTGYGFKTVVMPSTLENIETYAFYYSYLEELNFPSSLKEIKASGLSYMMGLKSASFPNDAVVSGTYLFSGCTELEKLTLPADIYNNCYIESENFDTLTITAGENINGISGKKPNLRVVTLPNTLKTIGVGAFRELTKLESIDIPDSVTTIGKNAFYGCTTLATVKFPSSLESIGDNAFENCEKLTSFIAPSQLKTIGYRAFAGSGLEIVELNEGLTTIEGEDNRFAFSNGPFENTKIKSLRVPSTVTYVCNFGRISTLETLYIPAQHANKVISSDITCNNSNNIRHLYLTGGELSYKGVFETDVYDIHISANVTSSVEYTLNKFDYPILIVNESAVKVTLHEEFAGEYATSEAAVKGRFVTTDDTLTFESDDKKVLIKYTGQKTVVEAKDLDGVTAIYRAAFNESEITDITLPGTVKIVESAFWNCAKLKTVFIPASVEYVSQTAFSGCGEEGMSIEFRCAAAEKPAGWSERWCSYTNADATVIWGATE